MISIALADADGYPSFKFAYSEVLTGSVKIQAGVWTYIAVTLSNTNGVIYLNNQTIGQMDMRVQNKLTVREVINIGKGVVNWDPAITGTFSDLKIFDQALTPDEIYANQFWKQKQHIIFLIKFILIIFNKINNNLVYKCFSNALINRQLIT